MNNSHEIAGQPLVKALSQGAAYGALGSEEVVCLETHISWVFLVGDFVFNIDDQRRIQCASEFAKDFLKILALATFAIN